MFKVEGELSIREKLEILADAAKYDVACTSSGVDRKGKKGALGNARACGICHSFASDGRCISLLKILMTNHCIYDCRYCVNRASNDVARTAFSPEEICELTVEFYKRNYIEGLFLSSGVWKDPAHTMEKICEALFLLRTRYRFRGYIHVKAIPGAPEELLAKAGYLADRISVNMELPTEESLRKLAPNKTYASILTPMKRISNTIAAHRMAAGKSAKMERNGVNAYLPHGIFSEGFALGEKKDLSLKEKTGALSDVAGRDSFAGEKILLPESGRQDLMRPFAPAGQSTQMIIGASEETDYHLLKTTQFLYQKFDLKRVFFSAYIPVNEDNALPALGTPPPLLREHRLYQADWLLRFYGFDADELLSLKQPNFNEQLDPKCNWALRHLERFPVEMQTAPMETLLRVPGIGPKSAKRIVSARAFGRLDFSDLKKMGVVLKRAHYFITCGGKMMYRIPIEERFLTRQLIGDHGRENWEVQYKSSQRQMSLFEDFGLQAGGVS